MAEEVTPPIEPVAQDAPAVVEAAPVEPVEEPAPAVPAPGDVVEPTPAPTPEPAPAEETPAEVVPVTVVKKTRRKRIPCEVCGGTGLVVGEGGFEHAVRCPNCNGTGKVLEP